ncbi:MAG: peptidylprolyl isomerase [Pseudomonadales bacterium]
MTFLSLLRRSCPLLLAMSVTSFAAVEVIDRVAVIVDDDIIMESELLNRIATVKSSIQEQGARMPPAKVLREQILNSMIVESLQLQMGERAGVRISDANLNEAMSNIAQQNRMNLQQFRQALESEGVSYLDTRENIRREMILKRVQQGNVNHRVQITEQEVDNFLESEEGQYMTAPDYHVGHVMLPVESGDADELAAAQQSAKRLVQELRDGRDFASLKGQKVDQFALQGGDLGWRKPDKLPSIFADVVPKLEIGGVADPISSDSGVHIIRLLERRGGGTKKVDQTHARHILIKPSEITTEAEAEAKLDKLYKRIVDKKEDFAALAKKHSEDSGSALDGGDLSWTTPGDLVPDFQKVMDATPIDGVSKPFKSNYGWHILQVLERRNEDISDKMLRNKASNFIYKRKFDEELEAWLQKIRDEAYVDIKK